MLIIKEAVSTDNFPPKNDQIGKAIHELWERFEQNSSITTYYFYTLFGIPQKAHLKISIPIFKKYNLFDIFEEYGEETL